MEPIKKIQGKGLKMPTKPGVRAGQTMQDIKYMWHQLTFSYIFLIMHYNLIFVILVHYH